MTGPIVFISRNRVKDGKLDDFKTHYRATLPSAEEGKPDTLVQVAYVDGEATQVTIVRLFPDGAAFDLQLEGAGERSKLAYRHIEPAGIEIYGTPSESALEALERISGPGSAVTVFPEFLGGFVRPGRGGQAAVPTGERAAVRSIAPNRSMPPGTIIPELAYPDVGVAVAWLCDAFGFQERLRIGDHRSQLVFGAASVVVTGKAGAGSGDSTHGLMVRVADVDRHYERARAAGARILHPPETYAYGERQYTVEDPGGHHWVFSQSVADVAPEEWGGQLTEGTR